MPDINKDGIEKIASQLDAFYTAVRCFVYYTEIKNIHNLENSNNFWDFIEFTLIYTMLINWNEIFGINAKVSHWKELTFEQDEYIEQLYIRGGYKYSSWHEYRREINDLCNSFISYPDPYHHKHQDYNLQGINVSLEVTHNWLHGLIPDAENILTSEELEKWPVTNKNYIEELKHEIQAIINKD